MAGTEDDQKEEFICWAGYVRIIAIEVEKKVDFHRNAPHEIEYSSNIKITEQFSHIKYLGFHIKYEYKKNVYKKLTRYGNICTVISSLLKNKTRKETKIKC